MIWDVHCHFPRNWDNPDDANHERAIDARADALRAAGVTRASLLCGGRFGLSYEEALDLRAAPRGPVRPRQRSSTQTT